MGGKFYKIMYEFSNLKDHIRYLNIFIFNFRLKDDNLTVRSTCVRMLSNLILGEMIRVKGQVAQLALCMVDENDLIRADTKQLFKDLSQKGNALYNVMPDILSCLSDSDLDLSEKNFQDIIK